MKRCLHGKEASEYAIEYAEKFWKAYPDQPKVFRLGFMDSHESTTEQINNLDNHLEAFLNRFESQGNLKNTFLMFMSDHGSNMFSLYDILDSQDFGKEKFLPLLYTVVPNSFNSEYIKGLESNEQAIITQFDIYNTLVQLSGAPNQSLSKNGRSLFSRIDNSTFSCKKYFIDKKYCVFKEKEDKM